MVIDLYVLTSERSTAVAKQFINNWLVDFNESASEYEFPQYSVKPTVIFSSVVELIEKLIANPNEPHSIYWSNPKQETLRSGMLFFTNDGAMIAGVTLAEDDVLEIAHYLQELGKTVGGQFGYTTFEEPPPETIGEFIDKVKASSPPKLFKGSLVV